MSPEELLQKGHDSFKKEEFQEAIQYYSQAILQKADLPAAFFYRGNAKSVLGFYKEAIADYDEVLLLDPDNPMVLAYRADIKAGLGQHKAAIEDYDQVIYLEPKDAMAIGNRGLAKFHLGQVEAAIDDYERALLIDPDNAETYGNRGVARFHLGLNEMAMEDYDQAINLNPQLAFPWRGKAIVYLKENNPSWAKIYFIRAAYLGSFSYRNAFAMFREHPIAPFFTLGLIREKVSPLAYDKHFFVVNTALRQCHGMYRFLVHQSFQDGHVANLAHWHKWLGIINYYMGDPVVAFRLLNSLAQAGTVDPMLHYYLIMSCFDFAEDEDPYLERAIAIAEPIRDQKVPNIDSKEDILAHYYAGLIFLLDEEPEDASICLLRIQNRFLPAAYFLLLLHKELGNQEQLMELKDYLLEQELKLGKKGYAKGLKEQFLSLEQEDLFHPFMEYFHYSEISEGIDLLAELTQETAPFSIKNSTDQKAFYDHFSVEVKDIKNHTIESNLQEWESSLEKGSDLRSAFNSVKQTSKKTDLEVNLGQQIQGLQLKDTDYHQLLNYFYLQDQLSEYQRCLLYLYWLHQKIKQAFPVEAQQSAMKEGLEIIIGEDLSILTAISSGQILPKKSINGIAVLVALRAFRGSYAKSTLGQIFFDFYTQEPEIPDTFPVFKKALESFITDESERIGKDKFKTRFPIEDLK